MIRVIFWNVFRLWSYFQASLCHPKNFRNETNLVPNDLGTNSSCPLLRIDRMAATIRSFSLCLDIKNLSKSPKTSCAPLVNTCCSIAPRINWIKLDWMKINLGHTTRSRQLCNCTLSIPHTISKKSLFKHCQGVHWVDYLLQKWKLISNLWNEKKKKKLLKNENE